MPHPLNPSPILSTSTNPAPPKPKEAVVRFVLHDGVHYDRPMPIPDPGVSYLAFPGSALAFKRVGEEFHQVVSGFNLQPFKPGEVASE